MQIACATCQGPVGFLIKAAFGKRKDMIDFKRNVKNAFRRVAILASMPSAFGNEGIMWVHRTATVSLYRTAGGDLFENCASSRNGGLPFCIDQLFKLALVLR